MFCIVHKLYANKCIVRKHEAYELLVARLTSYATSKLHLLIIDLRCGDIFSAMGHMTVRAIWPMLPCCLRYNGDHRWQMCTLVSQSRWAVCGKACAHSRILCSKRVVPSREGLDCGAFVSPWVCASCYDDFVKTQWPSSALYEFYIHDVSLLHTIMCVAALAICSSSYPKWCPLLSVW